MAFLTQVHGEYWLFEFDCRIVHLKNTYIHFTHWNKIVWKCKPMNCFWWEERDICGGKDIIPCKEKRENMQQTFDNARFLCVCGGETVKPPLCVYCILFLPQKDHCKKSDICIQWVSVNFIENLLCLNVKILMWNEQPVIH